MKLKVLTYNIHHGRGTDGKLDLQRIAEIIRKSEADIIGLNEVDSCFSKRSNYEDQLKVLGESLQMEYAFAPALTLRSKGHQHYRQYGNGLLSRYPIVEHQVHHFNFLKGIIEGRSLLQASIKVNHYHLNAFVTHLSLNPFLHNKQTASIIQLMKESPVPFVLMGDWNMRPFSKNWRELVQYCHDAWQLIQPESSGYTYSSKRPHVRIDYIFTSRNLAVHSAKVLEQQTASDHLPLLVECSIIEENAQ